MHWWFRRTAVSQTACYFLHIPKTAGTSLKDLLKRQYAPEAVCPAWSWQGLIAIPEKQLSQYRCFAGHLGYPLIGFLARPLQTFTFLRDPLEQALSTHAHILREPRHRHHAAAKAHGTLLAFLQDPRTLAVLANVQSRSLALDFDCDSFRAHRDPSEVEAEVTRGVIRSEQECESDGNGLLRRAIGRLEKLNFVGLVEHYEDSLRHLFDTFGFPVRDSGPTLNVSPNRRSRESLSSEERTILEKNLRLDFELYERGKALFRQQTRLAA